MVSILERVIKFIIVQSLSVFYSITTVVGLLFAYITNFTSAPWRSRDRTLMEPPACLSDPKYGQHKYITLSNKIRLHYVESGDNTKPLMVFIHGFPEFWYSWRHQITEFSKDYWVVAMDLRGYGQSDKPRRVTDHKFDLIVGDIKELIERLDRKQCILVGHDRGARIGFEFVSKHRHMVHKYIMMGAPSMRVYNRVALSNWIQFKNSWYYFMFLMPGVAEKYVSHNDFELFHLFWNKKFNDNFTEEDLEAYKYVYSRPGALTASLNNYRANSSFLSVPKASNDDGSNGLFVMGQRDYYNSAQVFCTEMAVEYPKLRVEVIPNANHFVQQDKPEAINSLIREFLGSPAKYAIEKFT